MENTKDLFNCDSHTLAREAVKILIEKKGIDVKLFDVRESSSVTDFYVNVTGRSSSQVSSLADDVDALLAQRGRAPLRTEGKRGNSWILVDFGDVIINVFDRESREFYNLDRHFPEEAKLDISELIAEVDKKFEIKNAEE
jgi:ribosome-associated protein